MCHFLIALLLGGLLLTQESRAESYSKSPLISETVWNQLQPYLLPANHPLKGKLDALFSQGTPLKNEEALRRAGFKFRHRTGRFMAVARHSKLKGYLIKAHLDDHEIRDGEWMEWIRRIQGAQRIERSIEAHGYQHLLKVPKKWIYPLPLKAISKPGAQVFPKQFVLLVEDMQIVKYGKNLAKYRYMMDEEMLEALFVVLSENRLFDSMFLPNIPFCKDHKIAFIDTEHFSSVPRPMRYDQMLPRLSPELQAFWKQLVARMDKS